MAAFFEWFAMGGYSAYVWSAYGLVGVVLIMNFFSIRWQKSRIHQKLHRWFKR